MVTLTLLINIHTVCHGSWTYKDRSINSEWWYLLSQVTASKGCFQYFLYKPLLLISDDIFYCFLLFHSDSDSNQFMNMLTSHPHVLQRNVNLSLLPICDKVGAYCCCCCWALENEFLILHCTTQEWMLLDQ